MATLTKFLAGDFFVCVEWDSTLLHFMEANPVMIYQIQEAVKDAALNLNDIVEEGETPVFGMNVKIVKETEESDSFLMANSVTVSIPALNLCAHKLKKICWSSSGSTSKSQVYVIQENIALHNARLGNQKVENFNPNLITSIVLNHISKISKTARNLMRYC